MFGFIKNFKQAVLLRILEGLFNGNMAIIRTMAAEVVSESRYGQALGHGGRQQKLTQKLKCTVSNLEYSHSYPSPSTLP